MAKKNGLYRIVSPSFWTGSTGHALRGDANAQVLALYLITNPHANMIGLYRCPKGYQLEDLGMDEGAWEGAWKGLTKGGFATFDRGSQVVYVPQMLHYQLGLKPGESLAENDNRRKAALRLLDEIPECSQKVAFLEDHGKSLGSPLVRGLEAPSNPLGKPEEQKNRRTEEQKKKGEAQKPEPKADQTPEWKPGQPVRSERDARIVAQTLTRDRVENILPAKARGKLRLLLGEHGSIAWEAIDEALRKHAAENQGQKPTSAQLFTKAGFVLEDLKNPQRKTSSRVNFADQRAPAKVVHPANALRELGERLRLKLPDDPQPLWEAWIEDPDAVTAWLKHHQKPVTDQEVRNAAREIIAGVDQRGRTA